MARRPKPLWHSTGRWCFTVTLPDRKRKTIYDKTGLRKSEKAAAAIWLDGILESLEARKVTGGDYTINDLRLAYLTWANTRVETGKMAPVTFREHRKILKRICLAEINEHPFGVLIARNLTSVNVRALQALWSDKSDTTIRNRLSSLLTVLNWAAQPRHDRTIERLIPKNPIEGIELPAVTTTERYAPVGEVKAFLRFVWDWAEQQTGHSARFAKMLAVLIEVTADSGCRPGELCVARWSHIPEGRRVISLPPGEHKTGRRTKKYRHIIIQSEDTFNKILELKNSPDRHPEFIFTHRTHGERGAFTVEERKVGVPWDSSRLSRRVKHLRQLAIKAGVLSEDHGPDRMTLYRLRHSFATDAVQSGVPIADVAGLIGNSAKITERVYLHQQLSHLEQVAERVKRGDQ